jgi:NADH dehydrogenase FAD-containing subunit
MERLGVRQLLGHKCIEVLPNGVRLIDGKGEETLLKADIVCYSVGMKSDNDTAALLKGAAGSARVFEIGDCKSVGKVANATESAYRAAMEIA